MMAAYTGAEAPFGGAPRGTSPQVVRYNVHIRGVGHEPCLCLRQFAAAVTFRDLRRGRSRHG